MLYLVTTLMNINKYGSWGVELNPIMRYFGDKGLFAVIGYWVLMTTLAVLVVRRFKYRNIVFNSFSFISILCIIINIWCLTL